jgi:hypothetical protein
MEMISSQVAAGQANAGLLRVQDKKEARASVVQADEDAVGGDSFFEALSSAPAPASKSYGKQAVQGSIIMKQMAGTETSSDMLITVKRVSNKTFKLKNGTWYESRYVDKNKFDFSIRFMSHDYLRLLEKDRTLNRILSLGPELVFEWNGKTYKIYE